MIMLKGIEKTYCGKEIKTKVLKGVDLSISKGEFVCIFGESGSGKSTLGRVICGLLKPEYFRVIGRCNDRNL